MPDTEIVDKMLVVLSAAQSPLYAVLDGAKLENLPDLFFDHDFSHKPLYRDMGSEVREVAQTTPQFVRFDTWDYWENDLSPAKRLDALLELMDVPSAGVFWEYDGEPKRLFRHLRTINNIMIPRDADTPPMPDPLDPEGETFGNTPTHQQVLFRHADANVLAQVLPVLSPKQLTRFMGPAQAVIFAPDQEWSPNEPVIRFKNPKDTYTHSHPLKLSQEDMDAIEEQRLVGQRWSIIQFLREKAPEHCKPHSDKDLYDRVFMWEMAGEDIGLEDDEAYRAWSLLAILSGGNTVKDPMLRQRFQESHKKPDQLVTVILDEWEN